MVNQTMKLEVMPQGPCREMTTLEKIVEMKADLTWNTIGQFWSVSRDGTTHYIREPKEKKYSFHFESVETAVDALYDKWCIGSAQRKRDAVEKREIAAYCGLVLNEL